MNDSSTDTSTDPSDGTCGGAPADATADFAGRLRALRESVGNPSFRTMSGRSRAISHTTLHEAAQGHRLPSWPTTVEFVKACGADPDDYRGRWEQARDDIRTAPRPKLAPVVGTGAVGPTPPPARRVRPGLRWASIAAAVVATLGAGALGLLTAGDTTDDGSGSSPATANQAVRLSSADCPVKQRNPPPAAPRHHGDASVFVADIRLPDCTHVAPGREVAKVWRLKNTGTRTWTGYTLHRVDLPEQRDGCQTITDVAVPTTRPGQIVDVRVEVTTPPRAAFCFVRFKMQDASGRLAFPGSRPVNFQLIVD